MRKTFKQDVLIHSFVDNKLISYAYTIAAYIEYDISNFDIGELDAIVELEGIRDKFNNSIFLLESDAVRIKILSNLLKETTTDSFKVFLIEDSDMQRLESIRQNIYNAIYETEFKSLDTTKVLILQK